MDVRQLCSGSTLYLPVLNRGALFSAGDAHAAQGDGEVCINGIECPVDATLRFDLHKQRALAGPLDRVARDPRAGRARRCLDRGGVRYRRDRRARAATSRMIDLLVARWRFSDVHAYLLCSVAMHLRLSQVVNEPMFTVSAADRKTRIADPNAFLTSANSG